MEKHHVCPWWMGYILANPLRRLRDDPYEVVGPFVREGMTILDAGCAMGFFSLPCADMVGDEGSIVCVDLQERMINTLRRRARRAGLIERIETRVCTSGSLMISDLCGRIDLALAYGVLHEVPDRERFVHEIYRSLKQSGKLLIGEPKFHVNRDHFLNSVNIARDVGFGDAVLRNHRYFWIALFEKCWAPDRSTADR
jgi:ubiquinone/menaquinone biosynthesis C-methylase UbiE